jgi:hypothetical protein
MGSARHRPRHGAASRGFIWTAQLTDMAGAADHHGRIARI